MSSKVRKEDTNIFIGEPSQKKRKSVREGDINRMKELGAQWQLSVGVVGVKKDVACSGIEVGVPGTHRKIWLAICGKLATAPPTAWTHCGVDMAPSFHALFISMVGGRKGPLVQ
jgi:hypothetical protein